ncbi:MAG: 4-alpha-glucanotransferase, partial [Bradymonadia bacterium]
PRPPPHVHDPGRHYLGVGGHDLVWDLNRAALASVADTAILAMQDVLALDSSGRMNTPAVGEGNWGWRVHAHALRDDHAERLRGLCALFDRSANASTRG